MSNAPSTLSTANGEFIIYESEDGNTEIHLRLIDNTVWMTQAEIAELFNVGIPAISKHIKNIYEEGEHTRASTVSKLENVAHEQGRLVRRNIEHYNLDIILSIGYRVRSPRGSQFRKWAKVKGANYRTASVSIIDPFIV